MKQTTEGGSRPGVLADGVFWYWNQPMSIQAIGIRAARRQAANWIGIASILVGIFLFLGYLLIEFVLQPPDIFFAFRPSLAIFFASVLAFMFAWFWKTDQTFNKHTLPKSKQPAEYKVIQSLDQIDRKQSIHTFLSGEAREAIDHGFDYAHKAHHAQVTAVHLFLGTLSAVSVRMLFMRLGLSFSDIKEPVQRHVAQYARGETVFGMQAQEILAKAFEHAMHKRATSLSAIELFAQCFAASEFLQELFFSLNAEVDDVKSVIEWMRINEQLRERYDHFKESASFKATGTMNRAYTSIQTPFLDSVSEDLTKASVRGTLPMLIGRQKEMQSIMRIIEGGGKSVLLVGPNGVGKAAMVAGIAERMVEERVPELLQDKRLVQISIPHILSGEGQPRDRLLRVLQEIGASGNIIVVIEGIDQLVTQGVDLSSLLVTELEKRYTYVIATTTPAAYTQIIEKTALPTMFEAVQVAEPGRADAIAVLQSRIGGIENRNKVVFTYDAVAAIVDYAMRYMHETFLPGKAITLAQEVGLAAKNPAQDWAHVSKEAVARIVSEKTNVPVTELSQDEKSKLLNLEEQMHERIIGQDHAVKAVASALRRARTELASKNRPIANFLFLGSTGVGKTELAKTTAQVYFGSENAMIRFDMSEFQDKDSVNRLIGGPNQAGQLTEAVRKTPFALVLLDELEKAHPDILNLFLQVMDDGRLSDGTGRTIDFTNVILIATSNAGTSFIQDEVAKGTDVDQIKMHLMENQLREVYRPEFLNRFDGVMVFKPLTLDDVSAIAYLLIGKVAKRLEAKGIHFRATDEAVHELAEKGFDPKFGARPLRRVIQEHVDNTVADYLLRGEVSRRDTLVLKAGGVIEVEKAAEL